MCTGPAPLLQGIRSLCPLSPASPPPFFFFYHLKVSICATLGARASCAFGPSANPTASSQGSPPSATSQLRRPHQCGAGQLQSESTIASTASILLSSLRLSLVAAEHKLKLYSFCFLRWGQNPALSWPRTTRTLRDLSFLSLKEHRLRQPNLASLIS